jgi:hypothetical protein
VTNPVRPTNSFKYWRIGQWTAAVLALALNAACSTIGDFGRVPASLQNDDMHAWLGPAAYRPPETPPPWHHQLTEDERQLRDYAFPLIEPPYERNRWYSVISEYGLSGRPWPYPDRAAYASRLFTTAYRSQNARYGRLIEDIRNDVTRLEPFFRTAQTVLDLDRKREKSLAYITGLSREEYTNTVTRMRENQAIVRWVQTSVNERVASYRLALERMVIAAPSQMAVEAERSLTLLQQRAGAHGV